jgi:hypothetical protein
MDTGIIIKEIQRYEQEIAGILSRFTRDHDGFYIGNGDDPPVSAIHS